MLNWSWSYVVLCLADDRHCDAEVDQTVPLSVSLKHKDSDTQWVVHALMDHRYILGEKRKLVFDRETQCGGEKHLTHAILKNDTSSVSYTGLSLSVFFDHIKYLQQFYKSKL